jgi:hypothetical protein
VGKKERKTMKRMNMRHFEKMKGNVGSIASIWRLFRKKTPALISFLGLLVLMLIIFNSTGDLGGFRQHLTSRAHHSEEEEAAAEYGITRRSSSSSITHLPDNSIRSLKELVKEAMDKGLVIIVNATRADADQLYADNPRGALPQWDVNAALDGPTGEILTEVIQELQNMEELQKEVATLRLRQKDRCKTPGAANSLTCLLLNFFWVSWFLILKEKQEKHALDCHKSFGENADGTRNAPCLHSPPFIYKICFIWDLLCLWWYLKLVIIFLTFVTQITMVLKTSGNLCQRSACI